MHTLRSACDRILVTINTFNDRIMNLLVLQKTINLQNYVIVRDDTGMINFLWLYDPINDH
ncbi:MAG: hypothetical protein EBS29_14605 [Chloroflexia bacterium]|nr:hypothetical protein [Chloroflexia bacterium]